MTCNCCCEGCQTVAADRSLASGAFNEIQTYCCRCIPIAVCMSAGGLAVWSKIYCVEHPSGEDPILYQFEGFTINGLSATFNLRFSVDDYNVCSVCIDSPEIGSNDCVEIVHDFDGYTNDEFCCTFAETWTVDTSSFGSGADATTEVSIAKYDATKLKGKIKCAGCNCVCSRACVTTIGTSGGGSVTYDGVLDTVTGAMSWGPVSLHGKGDPTVESRILTNGTETGTYDDTNLKDGVFHQIDADGGGEIDVEYLIDTHTTQDPIELHWWGYAQGDDSVLEFWEWDWTGSVWVSLGTFTGRATSVLVLPKYLEMAESPGGVDSHEVKIRITSSTADLVATDWIDIKSPDCCKLYYTDDYGVETAGIDILPDNTCPDPEGVWNLNDSDATVVSFACLKCNDCGTVFSGCCPDPVPTLLMATITSPCYLCDSIIVPISYNTASGIWQGSYDDDDCHVLIVFGCTGGSWEVTSFEFGPCTQDGSSTVTSESCDPLDVTLTVDVVGIACCSGGGGSEVITIDITE